MGSEFYQYITKDGDRWDLIAYDYYGDPTMYEPIIAANPDIPITPVLKSGLNLSIPVIDTTTTTSTEDLPPWKQ